MAEVIVVHPKNPQERNIQRIAELLRDGAVAVLPTDSGYALGCVLENKDARERIIRIRNVDKNHNFTLLCADLSELATYSKVDNTAFRLIRNNTPGPYTFILKGTKEVPKKLMNEKRKTIGLRVPENNIISELLRYMGEPLMSVSLILPDSEKAENDPYEIDDKIGKLVDVIVDGGYLAEQPT
ncbi:MAG: threonylcarbamoyl-AMP synthase, partial [Ruminobacter sp.]|nr:threonylcarbamoyl-AMP synthase [Ruminobacter sp.]